MPKIQKKTKSSNVLKFSFTETLIPFPLPFKQLSYHYGRNLFHDEEK